MVGDGGREYSKYQELLVVETWWSNHDGKQYDGSVFLVSNLKIERYEVGVQLQEAVRL